MLKSFYNETLIEAGLDEAGRGCLAGPVVAAAVILPKYYEHQLLNDSKQLTKKQREILRVDIMRDALAYQIAEVSNQEIDEINILKASMKAMHLATDKLTIRPEHLLIDGNRFPNYPLIPHTCIVKGDSKFMSIAAASILAKTYRDDLMEGLAKEFPEYGWEKNAGYPTVKHRQAIKEFGVTVHHRLTFRFER
ncbi:RNase HII [Arcicella aurantiaca]|uniref:Ribonuclease HII n=1 Tax=Arcicella aurantiaca TaxID=591202 RepID=A0A316F0H1_9BACT|nr:ribonuclease HII [Arcicella aurantiaca]PWK29066.1 RNase HII [Arcicella aurantiaca]